MLTNAFYTSLLIAQTGQIVRLYYAPCLRKLSFKVRDDTTLKYFDIDSLAAINTTFATHLHFFHLCLWKTHCFLIKTQIKADSNKSHKCTFTLSSNSAV